MNASWRNAPAPLDRSIDGKIDLKIETVSGGSWASAFVNDGAAAPKTKPMRPTPTPHHTASGKRSPNDRAVGPARPSRPDGMLGHGIREVTPRSRRAKAQAPTAKRTIATAATGTSEAQSASPASGWWRAVQPNQVRFASGAKAGTVAW